MNGLRKAGRGDYFDRLVAEGKLTADGKNWLLAALDPYHDFEHPIAGYPDMSSAKTIVKLVQQTYSIAKPTGLAAGALWDCHFLNIPMANATGDLMDLDNWTLNETTGVATSVLSNWTNTGQFGTISAIAVAAGKPTIFNPGVATSRTITGSSPLVPGVTGTGALRVVGAGFEVTNTTAELSKQGSVTVYSYATALTDDYFVDGVVPKAKLTAVDYVDNAAEAYRIPGSVQWAAAEGVYVPLRLATTRNPVTSPTCVGVTLFPARNGTSAAQKFSAEINTANSEYHFPYNTSGAYFTGLSETTTLTLTTRYYVEVQPALNSTLLDLVSPPAEYDPFALELYTRITNALPPGARKGDNDAGDWFRNIGRTAGNIMTSPLASQMLSMTPAAGLLPLMQMAGRGLSSIPDQRLFKRPEPKKSAQPVQKKLTAQAIVNTKKPLSRK